MLTYDTLTYDQLDLLTCEQLDAMLLRPIPKLDTLTDNELDTLTDDELDALGVVDTISPVKVTVISAWATGGVNADIISITFVDSWS